MPHTPSPTGTSCEINASRETRARVCICPRDEHDKRFKVLDVNINCRITL